YLQASLKLGNDPQSHALLGSLYDRLDRPADAVRHWRLATAARMALPVLATDAALPAAETDADPGRLDAEGGYETLDGAVQAALPADAPEDAAPPAASAADYVLEPDARGVQDRPAAASAPAAQVPLRSAVDVEEYFDSAPFPPSALEIPTSEAVPPAADPSEPTEQASGKSRS